MIFTMTTKIASSCKDTIIHKFKSSRCGLYDLCIKIYQMRVIGFCSLRTADTMRIMTLIAWNIFFNYMFAMYVLAEIIIPVNYSITIMAFITQAV